MSRSLPPHPSLDKLKHQAKELLKAHKRGDAEACATLKRHHRFTASSTKDVLAAAVSLQEVQHALALDYGFKGWKEMRDHVEANRNVPSSEDAAGPADGGAELSELRGRSPADRIVGESPNIREAVAAARAAASSRASVLITGESGTGKEIIANAVHFSGARARKPLVKVDCGTGPELLLESTLFGHAKGAFTGAVADRRGHLEQADGGTVFLADVGRIGPGLQSKLARFLREGEFVPVGSTRTIAVDVRVLAGAPHNLEKAVKEDRFREDLYYRLNVIPIRLKPLRDRREDIPLLVNWFLERACKRNGKNVAAPSQEVLEQLTAHDWQGNVRELEAWVERAVVMSSEGVLSTDSLPVGAAQ